jgi:hypothetical protein
VGSRLNLYPEGKTDARGRCNEMHPPWRHVNTTSSVSFMSLSNLLKQRKGERSMCIALTPLDRTDRRKQDTCSRRRDHGLVADSDLHYCSVEYPNRVCVGCRARSRDARDLFFSFCFRSVSLLTGNQLQYLDKHCRFRN